MDRFHHGELWGDGAGSPDTLSDSYDPGPWFYTGTDSKVLLSVVLGGSADPDSLEIQVEWRDNQTQAVQTMDLRTVVTPGIGVVEVDPKTLELLGTRDTYSLTLNLPRWTVLRLQAKRTAGAGATLFVSGSARPAAPFEQARGGGGGGGPPDPHAASHASGGGDQVDHNTLPNLAVGDVHTQYLLLAGRAGGQSAIGGTAALDALALRGSSNASLGSIQVASPIVLGDVAAAYPTHAYPIAYTPTQVFTAGFIGGGINISPAVTFQSSLFIWEALRGSPAITSGANPGFAAFTLFQALPVFRTNGTWNLLQALVLNAGPAGELAAGHGTKTWNQAAAINFAPQLRTTASGVTLNCTAVIGMTCAPVWNTAAGSTVNFGTIYGVRCLAPSVALFGSSAGVETMAAYYGLYYANQVLGSNATRAAVYSLQNAGTNAYGIFCDGNAVNRFDGPITQPVDYPTAYISQGASGDLLFGWAAAGAWFWQPAVGDQVRWLFAAGATTFQNTAFTGSGTKEIRFGFERFSFGQTGAIGNQVGVFVAGARSTAVGGGWSDFLLTQAGNLTVDHAMSQVAGWTINAPSMTLGTGSVTDAMGLLIGGNPNQGTNRYGLLVLSSPSGGTLNYCARFQGAAGVLVDGLLEHAGSSLGFYGATPVAQAAAYTPTNVTPDRAYDANATTVAELADVLGTLIADLQAVGLVG